MIIYRVSITIVFQNFIPNKLMENDSFGVFALTHLQSIHCLTTKKRYKRNVTHSNKISVFWLIFILSTLNPYRFAMNRWRCLLMHTAQWFRLSTCSFSAARVLLIKPQINDNDLYETDTECPNGKFEPNLALPYLCIDYRFEKMKT